MATEVPVDGFTYGMLTPVLAFVVAVLGSALGLRCTVRAMNIRTHRRAGWLGLGALAIGTGIFTMHFIGMLGFTAHTLPIAYDPVLTFASMAVAVLVVGLGVFLVGYSRRTAPALLGGGLITGLGVAGMHYMGMYSMQMDGRLVYTPAVVVVSVVIAVVAATAALWFATTVRTVGASLGASVLMGIAVTGMHYTGMLGVTVHAHGKTVTDTRVPIETLLPVLGVAVLLLVFVGLFVGLDPMMEEEADNRRDRSGPRAPHMQPS